MNQESGTRNQEQPNIVWLCLRSQPRRERLAAASVCGMEGVVDVFAPEVRVRRKTRRGAVWFVEALFPSYVFVQVSGNASRRELAAARGVSCIVRFGEQPGVVDAGVVASLRATYGDAEYLEIDRPLEPGEEAEVVAGPFQGFVARVLRCADGAGRVAVLVEMMGRHVEAALGRDCLDPVINDLSLHPLANTG